MNDKKKWFPTGGQFLSNLMVVLIGITFFLTLSNLDMVRTQINSFLSVITPFLAGLALAYLLNAPTVFLEKTLFSRFKFRRGISILATYLLALAALSVLLTLILPQVAQSIVSLANNLDTYLANFNALAKSIVEKFELDNELLSGVLITSQDLISSAAALLSNLVTTKLPQILDYGLAIGNGLVTALTALISSIYMLAGKERLIAQMRKLLYALFPKSSTDWFLSVCSRANQIFSGFIIGKILDSVIIGILCFFLCLLFRIPLAVLIGVTIGFTNIIPFFGPIIGAIPCALVLLIVDPLSCLWFLILILALQQFDGNILGPRILGNSTGLSAIWVLVAIVVGGGLFGFPGMVLGVPTFAVIYTLTRDWADRRLREKGIDGSGNSLNSSGEAENVQ